VFIPIVDCGSTARDLRNKSLYDLGWGFQNDHHSFTAATAQLPLRPSSCRSSKCHLTTSPHSHNRSSTTLPPNTLVIKHRVAAALQRPRLEIQLSRTQTYVHLPILHIQPWSLTWREWLSCRKWAVDDDITSIYITSRQAADEHEWVLLSGTRRGSSLRSLRNCSPATHQASADPWRSDHHLWQV
jgi:hypothetical protein